MSTSRRRKAPYHHGDLPPALLRAAADILEKQGLEALTLRDLARRAGVSHNAPYRHFTDREALLAALAEDGFRTLGKALEGKSGSEMGEAYVRFGLAHPARFRLMFGGRLPREDHPALREAAGRAHEALLQAIRARQDLPDPEIAAAAAWSLVHGLANLLLDGHFEQAIQGGADLEQFVKRVLGSVRFAGAAQRSA
jgi:AcrR family transcriptional regulator